MHSCDRQEGAQRAVETRQADRKPAGRPLCVSVPQAERNHQKYSHGETRRSDVSSGKRALEAVWKMKGRLEAVGRPVRKPLHSPGEVTGSHRIVREPVSICLLGLNKTTSLTLPILCWHDRSRVWAHVIKSWVSRTYFSSVAGPRFVG